MNVPFRRPLLVGRIIPCPDAIELRRATNQRHRRSGLSTRRPAYQQARDAQLPLLSHVKRGIFYCPPSAIE